MITDQSGLHSVLLPLLIILEVKQIGQPCNHWYDYRRNWTLLSPITIINYILLTLTFMTNQDVEVTCLTLLWLQPFLICHYCLAQI